jgi:hypothetical protein
MKENPQVLRMVMIFNQPGNLADGTEVSGIKN